jgi:hypothetical protein
MMRNLRIRTLALPTLIFLLGGVVTSSLQLPMRAETNTSNENLLLAQSQRFPLRGSKFTELGDHRRIESSITISNNGRLDGVTRIWTDKLVERFYWLRCSRNYGSRWEYPLCD